MEKDVPNVPHGSAENGQKPVKKSARKPSKSRKLYDRLRKRVARGAVPRDVCRHVKPDGTPCLCPGSPIIVDPNNPARLAWACRLHRNAVKASLGLIVYRKPGMVFKRRWRKLPYLNVRRGMSVEKWLATFPPRWHLTTNNPNIFPPHMTVNNPHLNPKKP